MEEHAMMLSTALGPTKVSLLEETIPQNLARTVAAHGERDALDRVPCRVSGLAGAAAGQDDELDRESHHRRRGTGPDGRDRGGHVLRQQAQAVAAPAVAIAPGSGHSIHRTSVVLEMRSLWRTSVGVRNCMGTMVPHSPDGWS